jgi:ankyrin repeat protein
MLIPFSDASEDRMSMSTSLLRSSSALDKISVVDRRVVLAGLLSPSFDARDTTAVSRLTSELGNILPEQLDGEAALAIREFLDPTTKDPLQDLFKLATYFFSNNILTGGQKKAFLRWIMDKNYTEQLTSFLAIPATGVDGFRHGIIAAIMDMQDLNLVEQLVQSGIRFNDVLAQSTGVTSDKFFKSLLEHGLDRGVLPQLSSRVRTLILERTMKSKDEKLIVRLLKSRIRPELLAGEPGGRLLQLVVKEGFVEATRILIQNDCDINFRCQDYGHTATPLWYAASSGYVEIVKCLVEASADLNKSSSESGYPGIALAMAVKRGWSDIISTLVEGGASLQCAINGRDIFDWSSQNNIKIYQHLCKSTGRSGGLDSRPGRERVTVDDIVQQAARGSQSFATFHHRHRANITERLLEEALVSAVKGEKFDATSILLLAGVDPNTAIYNAKEPPIYHAAWITEVDILQLLLDSGASPNVDGLVYGMVGAIEDGISFEAFEMLVDSGLDLQRYGPELLVDAAEYENLDIVALLVEKGVSPNSYNKPQAGLTSLQAASGIGNMALIEYLRENGGDINQPASKYRGRTALQAACENERINIVRFLLNQGADVNALQAAKDGMTALEASLADTDSTELFSLLLEHGARIDHPRGGSSRILRTLVDRSHFDFVPLALEANANVNEMSSDRGSYKGERTALQLAAEKGDLDLVKLLLSHNGDINRPAWRIQGRTALQAAVSRKKPDLELVQYLIDNGADVNAPPGANGGLTALQGAAIQGHIKIALLLLENSANPNASAALKNGRKAIEGAAEHGRLDVVKLLLNAEAKGDIWNREGFKKAIELAKKNRRFTVAEMLRAHPEGDGEERRP